MEDTPQGPKTPESELTSRTISFGDIFEALTADDSHLPTGRKDVIIDLGPDDPDNDTFHIGSITEDAQGNRSIFLPAGSKLERVGKILERVDVEEVLEMFNRGRRGGLNPDEVQYFRGQAARGSRIINIKPKEPQK